MEYSYCFEGQRVNGRIFLWTITVYTSLSLENPLSRGYSSYYRFQSSGRMPEDLFAAKALYMGMEVVIAVSSVIGNVMVVWAVKINRSLRDTTFCFIVSLALADIAVGALVIPLAITISIGLQTHFYSCLLVACTVLVLTQSSILALLAIAIDRYLRVKIPTR